MKQMTQTIAEDTKNIRFVWSDEETDWLFDYVISRRGLMNLADFCWFSGNCVQIFATFGWEPDDWLTLLKLNKQTQIIREHSKTYITTCNHPFNHRTGGVTRDKNKKNL